MIQPNALATVHDILTYCAPPLELIEHLERYQQRQALPEPIVEWLAKWRTIRSDSLSLLDGVIVAAPP